MPCIIKCLSFIGTVNLLFFSSMLCFKFFNQFFGKTFNPKEAEVFIQSLTDKAIVNPVSFEDQALCFVGEELYEAFFKGYTKKQWGMNPADLPASILKRLPLRFNYDDNYYNHRFQGMPREGYTTLISNIIESKNDNKKQK